MRLLFITLFNILVLQLYGQLPYVEKLYDVRQELNILYGVDTNFCGVPIELYLDLYKPVGDDNMERPVFVFIHGGAFVGGDKADQPLNEIYEGFAKRGYVVASINYRMGIHIQPAPPNPLFCLSYVDLVGVLGTLALPCLHPYDEDEMIRAAYRATQDTKGAIRYLKGRHEIDSTHADQYFVGGHSAGGYAALLAGILDDDEIGNQVGEISAIDYSVFGPPYENGFENCYANNLCNNNTIHQRPSLGPLEGRLNVNNGYDASILGAWSFAGATLEKEWYDEDDVILYMNVQLDDPFVPCQTDHALYGFRDCEQNPLCGQLWKKYPEVDGTCSFQTYYQSQTNLPAAEFNIIECPDSCNSTCHWWPDISELVDSVAYFFSREALALSSITNKFYNHKISIYPNPSNGILHVDLSNDDVLYSMKIFDLTGQLLYEINHSNQTTVTVPLPQGLYLLQISDQSSNEAELNYYQKIMIQ